MIGLLILMSALAGASILIGGWNLWHTGLFFGSRHERLETVQLILLVAAVLVFAIWIALMLAVIV